MIQYISWVLPRLFPGAIRLLFFKNFSKWAFTNWPLHMRSMGGSSSPLVGLTWRNSRAGKHNVHVLLACSRSLIFVPSYSNKFNKCFTSLCSNALSMFVFAQVITALPVEEPPKCTALYDFIINDQNEKDCLTFSKVSIVCWCSTIPHYTVRGLCSPQ